MDKRIEEYINELVKSQQIIFLKSVCFDRGGKTFVFRCNLGEQILGMQEDNLITNQRILELGRLLE